MRLVELTRKTLEEVEERVKWEKPVSVGTAQVGHVLDSSPEHDMVFLDLVSLERDLTGQEHLFVPSGKIKKGQIVEVIVQRKRYKRYGTPRWWPPNCRLAIRPYDPRTYGKITPEDQINLASMLTYVDNEKNPFNSRALYRRFLGVDWGPITVEDVTGPGG